MSLSHKGGLKYDTQCYQLRRRYRIREEEGRGFQDILLQRSLQRSRTEQMLELQHSQARAFQLHASPVRCVPAHPSTSRSALYFVALGGKPATKFMRVYFQARSQRHTGVLRELDFLLEPLETSLVSVDRLAYRSQLTIFVAALKPPLMCSRN